MRAHRRVRAMGGGVQGGCQGPLSQGTLKLWRGGFGKSLLVSLLTGTTQTF